MDFKTHPNHLKRIHFWRWLSKEPMAGNIFQKRVLTIGQDQNLLYLLQRYARQCDCILYHEQRSISSNEIINLSPSAIIFLTIDELERAGKLVDSLTSEPILIIVCISPFDAVRANELGADICLVHPFTLAQFELAISQPLMNVK